MLLAHALLLDCCCCRRYIVSQLHSISANFISSKNLKGENPCYAPSCKRACNPCCCCCCFCRRYIVSQPHSISASFISKTLKATFPAAAAALPDGAESDATHINSSKVQQELGLQLTPVADTVNDMAASLIMWGIAKPAWARAGAL
jgi:hypothetical protein